LLLDQQIGFFNLFLLSIACIFFWFFLWLVLIFLFFFVSLPFWLLIRWFFLIFFLGGTLPVANFSRDGIFVQFILVSFFKFLAYRQAHEVVGYFDGYCPLRVVKVWEMIILFRESLNFFQHFLIVKFSVVSTFEIQHPTLDLTLSMSNQQLIKLIQHSEMLSPESPFDGQYSMTVSSKDSSVVVNIIHHMVDHNQRVYLFVVGIDLDEQNALNNKKMYIDVSVNLT
jgi:hypothetical protein